MKSPTTLKCDRIWENRPDSEKKTIMLRYLVCQPKIQPFKFEANSTLRCTCFFVSISLHDYFCAYATIDFLANRLVFLNTVTIGIKLLRNITGPYNPQHNNIHSKMHLFNTEYAGSTVTNACLLASALAFPSTLTPTDSLYWSNSYHCMYYQRVVYKKFVLKNVLTSSKILAHKKYLILTKFK